MKFIELNYVIPNFERVLFIEAVEDDDALDENENEIPPDQREPYYGLLFHLDTPYLVEDDDGNPVYNTVIVGYKNEDVEQPIYQSTGVQMQKQTVDVDFETAEELHKAIDDLTMKIGATKVARYFGKKR